MLFPKVELHCHLEATLRPETLRELTDDRSEPIDHARNFASLEEFFIGFRSCQDALADEAAWERLAYESVLDAAKDNVIYREAFFTPARQMAASVPLANIVRGLCRGLEYGEAATGMRTALIADIDRSHGPAAGLELVRQIADLRRSSSTVADRIIGIGMDTAEVHTRPEDFAAAYVEARRCGLRRTAHVGIDRPPRDIRTALDVLDCERIDHGLTSVEDANLASRIASEGIPLTICPSSNIAVGRYSDLHLHPFATMREAGFQVSLNTDNPALMGISLEEEYQLIQSVFEYSDAEMVDIAIAGVNSSWLDDAERVELVNRVRGHERMPARDHGDESDRENLDGSC